MTVKPAATRFVPTREQYAWTFGGCEPVMRIQPGEILDLYTEDAFAGQIRSSDVCSSENTDVAPTMSVIRPMAEARKLLPGSLALFSSS